MRLKAGYGYWRLDRGYPIGGDFERASADGKEVVEVLRTYSSTLKGAHGCNMNVKFADGTTGAVASEHIEGYRQ